MKVFVSVFLFSIFAIVQTAVAGPDGDYDVEQKFSYGASKGVVSIYQSRGIYYAAWLVDGKRYQGVGIGTDDERGTATFDYAVKNGGAIALSYRIDGRTNVALFAKQENGQWKGIWAVSDQDSLLNQIPERPLYTETWTKRP